MFENPKSTTIPQDPYIAVNFLESDTDLMRNVTFQRESVSGTTLSTSNSISGDCIPLDSPSVWSRKFQPKSQPGSLFVVVVVGSGACTVLVVFDISTVEDCETVTANDEVVPISEDAVLIATVSLRFPFPTTTGTLGNSMIS